MTPVEIRAERLRKALRAIAILHHGKYSRSAVIAAGLQRELAAHGPFAVSLIAWNRARTLGADRTPEDLEAAKYIRAQPFVVRRKLMEWARVKADHSHDELDPFPIRNARRQVVEDARKNVMPSPEELAEIERSRGEDLSATLSGSMTHKEALAKAAERAANVPLAKLLEVLADTQTKGDAAQTEGERQKLRDFYRVLREEYYRRRAPPQTEDTRNERTGRNQPPARATQEGDFKKLGA